MRRSLMHLIVLLLAIQAPAKAAEWSRYEITVELDTEAHTLSGSMTVEYLNDSDRPLEALYFQVAMAGPGLIVMGTDTFRLKDLVVPGLLDRAMQAGMAHEVAHLWWGAGVGFNMNAEPWLAESFAQYMAVRYFEDRYGAFGPNAFTFKKGLIEGLLDSEIGYANQREHNDELVYLLMVRDGFDQEVVKPWAEVEFATVWHLIGRHYFKGALVLRMLEGIVGRETMDRILQEAYKRYNHRVLTTQEFQSIAEEVSGRDLQEFFEFWLFSAEQFDARIDKVDMKKTEGGWVARVHLSRQGEIALPVVVCALTQGGETLEQTWVSERPQDVLLFRAESPIISVQLDPESLLLDANRFNNHWPRKFMVSWGKRILPLDAYAIRISPLGIEGGFRTDHRWALRLLPSPDPDDEKLLLSGLGAFMLDLGRGTSIDGRLSLRGINPVEGRIGPLTGEVGFNFVLWEHPETGWPGREWIATNRLRLAVGRRAGPESLQSEKAANYLALDYSRDGRPGRYWLADLSIRANLPGETPFLRLSLETFGRTRIMPNIYLDRRQMLGLSFGEVPQALKFGLEELRSFPTEAIRAQGNFKSSLELGLTFPLVRELDYGVLNLLIVDELWGKPFIRAGRTWMELQEVALDPQKLRVEAGLELRVRTKTLFGLPLELTFGFAYPLQGFEGVQRGEIYFAGVSLGGLLDF
jgi:hypothetical protein